MVFLTTEKFNETYFGGLIMKNIKILVVVLMAIFLVGCSKADTPSAVKVDLAEDNQQATFNTEEHTKHLTKVLGDNLELDADVFYPLNTEIATYSVERKIFSKDVINLFIDKEDTEYTIEDNPNYENSFTVNTGQGCSLSASEGYLLYLKNQEYDDVVAMIEELYLEEKSINETDELSFCNKKKAISIGEDKIKEFSDNQVEVIRMAAMGHKELEKLQEDLLKEESYRAGIDIGKTNEIGQFSEEDDVYYIEYAVKQDDIFLYSGIAEPQITMSIDAFWDFPVNVTMLIGNEGIRYFSYRNVLEKQTMDQIDGNIISAEEALETVQKIYDNIILTEPLKISKVWVQYILVPDWKDLKEIKLKPYWCIQIDSVDESGKTWSKAERINAITGGNLSYGE